MHHDTEGQPARHAVVVMGVSACGKTSTGEALARRLDLPFVDSDALHPASNIAKMESGQPLADEDRWPWLDRVGTELADRGKHPRGVVVACSALRRAYRDRIRSRVADGLVFVFLDVGLEEARRRIGNRKGHFMPPALIDSQFATLERPTAEEADVVDITRLDSPETSAQEAAAAIMAGHAG